MARLSAALRDHEHLSALRTIHTTNALAAHAAVCRAKVDATGHARDLFSYASTMTRADRYYVGNLVLADAPATMSAACDALHDLIMEGV